MTVAATGQEYQTPVKLKSTSATERAAFRRCRRQWFLGIVHRLGRAESNQNFWFGTLIHKGLEAYYQARKNGFPYDDAEAAGVAAYWELYDESLAPIAEELSFLWQSALPTYQEMGELGQQMLDGYFEKERAADPGWAILEVERRMTIPIRSKSGRKIGEFSFQLDLVVKNRNGGITIIDHKSAGREHNSAQLDLDDQLTAYFWGYWKATGDWPDEAIYNVLLKKAPVPPKLIKKGAALSQDKSQGTTYDLYLQAIRDHGFAVNDYSEMLAYFKDNPPSYFKREGVFRTRGQMAEFERNLLHEWADMRRVAAHPERAYPSPSPFNCPSCPVKTICTTLMDAGDAAAVISGQFIVMDPRR